MDKRVVLAVAGSGKTYHICNNIDKEKRNIIIAYTNQNIKNILFELKKKFGYVPQKTLVMTFHSFIYKFMIRPFDNLIGEYYGIKDFVSKGITIISPPEQSLLLPNGIRIKNPNYRKNDCLYHYVRKNKYYSNYLSKLILNVKKGKFQLVEESCNNIKFFFDNIYIDEMQDFRENNWKLLVEIIKRFDNILLVGDYNQHSVSAINNTGVPFKNKRNYINYHDYISYLNSIGLIVDDKTLIKSRRCSKNICEFISTKLGIKIESEEINNGEIKCISEKDEIMRVINDDKIVKMVWEKSLVFDFDSITWSYSKGDTYDDICILLTDTYESLNKDDFVKPTSIISINKLYVALTRSKGNVYLIKKNDFDFYMEKK